MRLKGKQLDGFNAALREGNQEKAMAELQGACARAEGIVPFASASGSLALPPLAGELKEILGMMIYSTAPIGRRLEQLGLYKVPRKVEEEHAAAIHWMLNLYFAHGDQWRSAGEKILKNEAPENDPSSRTGDQKPMNNPDVIEQPKAPTPVACSAWLGRITDEEMYRAVSGRAAIAEHDANAAQRCGLHGDQLEGMKRYAATLRAAANKLRPNNGSER